MPMKKRFYTMNSQMMAYDEGGVTKDFLTDHLGSITAEINQSQTRTYDTRYSAYGRNNWSTGTGCGFGWVGSYGYRETGLFHMSHYVRARHYSYITGNWCTVDPLWPKEASYGYVTGRPTRWIDPSGRCPLPCYYPNRCIFDGPPGAQCSIEYWHCYGPLPPKPDRPRDGNGDHVAGNWFWTIGYGNCCGYDRACNDTTPVIKDGRGKPDCLDLACRQHDSDIPTFWEIIHRDPHAKLCLALHKCDCAASYPKGGLGLQYCLDAKRRMIAMSCVGTLIAPLPIVL